MRTWLLAGLLALAPFVRPLRAQRPPNFELGGGFATLDTRGDFGNCGYCVDSFSGLDATLDVRMGSEVWLDFELGYFPQRGNGITSAAGGRMTEALFGARLALPLPFLIPPVRRRLRAYALVRPGGLSFEAVDIGLVSLFPLQFRFGRKTDNVLNYGGQIEIGLSRHTALRLELGDTIIFGQPPALGLEPTHTHNLQFGSAYVFVF